MEAKQKNSSHEFEGSDMAKSGESLEAKSKENLEIKKSENTDNKSLGSLCSYKLHVRFRKTIRRKLKVFLNRRLKKRQNHCREQV